MKRILSLIACLGLVLAFGASDASAIGIGFGVNIGSGDADKSFDGISAGSDDLSTADLGFVMDTNLSGDSTFNYRLTLAGASYEIKDSPFDDMSGITIINDFGFGIVKKPNFRLWMGPQLRLSWISQQSGNGQEELDLFSFGIGPVLGANFNIGSSATIALTGAYVFHTTNGEYYDSSGWWYDFESDGELFVLGASVIFRLNE